MFEKSFLLQDEKNKYHKPLLSKTDIIMSTNGVEMSNMNSNHYTTNTTGNKEDIDRLGNFGINVLNASAKWVLNQPDNSLNNINLTVSPGRLVAIIGPVGAGKV